MPAFENLSSADAATIRGALNTPRSGGGTSDPTATTDTAAGFSVGSLYINTTTGGAFVCRDATTGAARWRKSAVSSFPGYIPGRWYLVQDGAVGGGSAAVGDRLYLVPFTIRETVTITQLAARVSVTSAGGAFMIAIYQTDLATGRPTGQPVKSVVGMSTASASLVAVTLASSLVLEPGLYWTAVQADNTTARFSSITQSSAQTSNIAGADSLSAVLSASAGANLTFATPNTYGSNPDLTGVTLSEVGNSALVPVLAIRAS